MFGNVAGLLPSIQEARGYQRSWLRWDVLAGITVAAYLVPQCMAYGVLAGLDPVVGLWAALPSLALYALLGSSPQLSVGPESTCAIMTAIALAPLAAGDPARYAALTAALAVLVGTGRRQPRTACLPPSDGCCGSASLPTCFPHRSWSAT